MRAALVASCFLGALPPVHSRAVCLVRAMLLGACLLEELDGQSRAAYNVRVVGCRALSWYWFRSCRYKYSGRNRHWRKASFQYLQTTGQAILSGRVPGDLTDKLTRQDKRGEGSLLDCFAARAAVAKRVVPLQVLDDPSSLPVLCSDHCSP